MNPSVMDVVRAPTTYHTPAPTATYFCTERFINEWFIKLAWGPHLCNHREARPSERFIMEMIVESIPGDYSE